MAKFGEQNDFMREAWSVAKKPVTPDQWAANAGAWLDAISGRVAPPPEATEPCVLCGTRAKLRTRASGVWACSDKVWCSWKRERCLIENVAVGLLEIGEGLLPKHKIEKQLDRLFAGPVHPPQEQRVNPPCEWCRKPFAPRGKQDICDLCIYEDPAAAIVGNEANALPAPTWRCTRCGGCDGPKPSRARHGFVWCRACHSNWRRRANREVHDPVNPPSYLDTIAAVGISAPPKLGPLACDDMWEPP